MSRGRAAGARIARSHGPADLPRRSMAFGSSHTLPARRRGGHACAHSEEIQQTKEWKPDWEWRIPPERRLPIFEASVAVESVRQQHLRGDRFGIGVFGRVALGALAGTARCGSPHFFFRNRPRVVTLQVQLRPPRSTTRRIVARPAVSRRPGADGNAGCSTPASPKRRSYV
jgi:hypothetical protein